MTDKTKWAALVEGAGCPLDCATTAIQRALDLVQQLTVSSLYCRRTRCTRGQCQLIFDSRTSRVSISSPPSGSRWQETSSPRSRQSRVRETRSYEHRIARQRGAASALAHHSALRGRPDVGRTRVEGVSLDSMPDTRLTDDERAALIALLQKALAGPVTDMSGVGLTARWVAANRALESDHASPLYRDPYARELAGEAGFEVLYSMRTASGMGAFNGPDPSLTIRTRFYDDSLLNAVRSSSIDQVVILAAGMDARAFRLDWPAGVRVFEVDRDDVRTQGGRAHSSECDAFVRPAYRASDLRAAMGARARERRFRAHEESRRSCRRVALLPG